MFVRAPREKLPVDSESNSANVSAPFPRAFNVELATPPVRCQFKSHRSSDDRFRPFRNRDCRSLDVFHRSSPSIYAQTTLKMTFQRSNVRRNYSTNSSWLIIINNNLQARVGSTDSVFLNGAHDSFERMLVSPIISRIYRDNSWDPEVFNFSKITRGIFRIETEPSLGIRTIPKREKSAFSMFAEDGGQIDSTTKSVSWPG